MALVPDQRGWYSIEGRFDDSTIDQLQRLGPLERVSVTKIPLVTVQIARALCTLQAKRLWIWCDITRRAMRHLIRTRGLRVLDALCLRGPGHLANFDRADDLEKFRANHYMTESDLLQVARCAGLTEIGAQGAAISLSALSALLALPKLASLDLEGTRFDDKMAKRISRSTTITPLTERDLVLLLDLPDLEYVSLGNYDGLPSLDAEAVTALLLASPNLQRAWLDGIRLQPSQKAALEGKLESLRLTSLSGST